MKKAMERIIIGATAKLAQGEPAVPKPLQGLCLAGQDPGTRWVACAKFLMKLLYIYAGCMISILAASFTDGLCSRTPATCHYAESL